MDGRFHFHRSGFFHCESSHSHTGRLRKQPGSALFEFCFKQIHRHRHFIHSSDRRIGPATFRIFHIQNPLIFLTFSPIFIFGVIAAVNGGYLNGNLLFTHMGSLILIESISKFTFAGIFVALGFNELVYLSIPSPFFSAIASMYFVSRKRGRFEGIIQPFRFVFMPPR